MSKQFESIKKGLEQIITFENGDTSVKCRVRNVTIPDVEPVTEYSKEKMACFKKWTFLLTKCQF